MSPVAFLSDPVASHSARFPLGRPANSPASVDQPSPRGLRPWGLGWMHALHGSARPMRACRYDHQRQVAVDAYGQPLFDSMMAEATANKVSSNDGDEGPSEDFTYDCYPDQPQPV